MDDTPPDRGLPIGTLIQQQLHLQLDSFHSDPRRLEGDGRADFALWNAYALIDEIAEMMQEVKWKPWLTSGRGEWVDRDAFVGELVDAFHFMMNLLILADCDGHEFTARYLAKRMTNAKRQAEGYTGEKGEDGREVDRDQTGAAYMTGVKGELKINTGPMPADLTPAQLEHIRLQEENQ